MYIAVITGALVAIGYSFKYLQDLWDKVYLYYSFKNTKKFKENYLIFLPFTARDSELEHIFGFGKLNKASVKRYKTQQDTIQFKCATFALGQLYDSLLLLFAVFCVIWIFSQTYVLFGVLSFVFVCAVYVVINHTEFKKIMWPRAYVASTLMYYLQGKDLVKPTKIAEPIKQVSKNHRVKKSLLLATGVNALVVIIAIIVISIIDAPPESYTDYPIIFLIIFSFFEAIIIFVTIAYVLANKAERAVKGYFNNRKK